VGTLSSLIEVTQLEMRYGLTRAVQGTSFSIGPGESVGLLGLNGAGKTSTLKALLGLYPVSKGSVTVFGHGPGSVAALKKIGFAPEDGCPPDYLTGQEYLQFVASLKFRSHTVAPEVSELLNYFELDPKKSVRDYSKGMRRRLILAQALMARPELVILDEPLNGLDPLMIIKLRERLNQTTQQGSALLYSSHILSEVEKCCNRVIIMKEGRIVLDQSLEKLIQEFGSVENAFSRSVGTA